MSGRSNIEIRLCPTQTQWHWYVVDTEDENDFRCGHSLDYLTAARDALAELDRLTEERRKPV